MTRATTHGDSTAHRASPGAEASANARPLPAASRTPPNADREPAKNGAPLEGSVRSRMEGILGHDFSQVRIHSDAQAGEAAQAANANAFAAGNHLVFGPGRFSGTTDPGRSLLAHELTHVVQADRARTDPELPGSPVASLESEAHQVASAVADGRTAPPILGVAKSRQAPLKQPEDGPTFGNLPGDQPKSNVGARRMQLSVVNGKWIEHADGRTAPTRTAKGSYDFVVIGGSIWAVKSNSRDLGHTEAAGGNRVSWAGVISFDKQGRLKTWTNASGHYLPAGSFSQNATAVHSDLPQSKYVQSYRGPVTRPDGVRQGPQLPVFQNTPGNVPKPRSDAPPASGAPAATGGATTGMSSNPAAPTAPAASPPATAIANRPATPANSSTARTTVAGGRPPPTSAPGPRGQAVGGGVTIGVQAKDWIMGKLGDQVQGERMNDAMKVKLAALDDAQAIRPELGALVTIYWRIYRGNEGETSRRFEDIGVKYGTTEKEARYSRQNAHLDISSGPGDTQTDEQWIPPLEPLPLAELPTPQPKIAIGTFAPGRAKLQGVKWKGVSGFDTYGRRSKSLSVPQDEQPLFAILQPPTQIVFRNGQLRHTVNIGIERRVTDDDYLVPVVDALDAALVFPLDGATASLMGQGAGIHDTLRQLGSDYEMTRWVPASSLRIIEVLDAGQVSRRPPTAEETFQQRLRALPANAGDLLKKMGRGFGKKIRLTPSALERFEAMVPFDLTDAEVAALAKQMGPIDGQTLDQVLSNLEKAINALPGRTEGSDGPVGPDVAATIQRKLGGVDWAALPKAGGTFFRDKGPIGLAEGTTTPSFAYGVDPTGKRFGALVSIRIGKAADGRTPVTVVASSDLFSPDGIRFGPAGSLAGKTFRIRTLSEIRQGEVPGK